MNTLEYRVEVSSQEAMSCTRRRVGWLLADLGRINTERPRTHRQYKAVIWFKHESLRGTARLQGGTTGRGDGDNWFGVVKASELTSEIIGGRDLEASKAAIRMNAVFASALTCMTVSARKNSTYLYMIGMFKRRHARKFVLKNQPQ